MKSNRMLAQEISDMAKQAGVEVDMRELRNKEKLLEMHAKLRAQLGHPADAESEEPDVESEPEESEPERPLDPTSAVNGEDQDFGGPPPATENPPEPAFELTIGRNKAVTSPRGMLREFEEVKTTDFDEPTMNRLLAMGVVVKKKSK